MSIVPVPIILVAVLSLITTSGEACFENLLYWTKREKTEKLLHLPFNLAQKKNGINTKQARKDVQCQCVDCNC